jgi:2'-5' RNA ligase
METVLAITISLPHNLNKAVEKTQAKHFGKRTVDEAHITVYLCKFPTKNYEQLVSKLEKQNFVQLKVTYEKPGKDIVGNNVFYSLPIHSPELGHLHQKTLDIANKFRAGLIRNKDKRRLKQSVLEAQKVKYLMKYGYAQVLKNFNPHITLGTVTYPPTKTRELTNIAATLRFFKKGSFTAKALNIALCDYDEKTDSYYTKKLSKIILRPR